MMIVCGTSNKDKVSFKSNEQIFVEMNGKTSQRSTIQIDVFEMFAAIDGYI